MRRRVVERAVQQLERLDVRAAEAGAFLFDGTLQQSASLFPKTETVVRASHRDEQLSAQARLGVQVRVEPLDRGISTSRTVTELPRAALGLAT